MNTSTQSPSEVAEQRIAEAEATGATRLDLRSLELTVLPESVGRLERLSQLNLSRNRLESLPDSLSKLGELTELYIGFNKFISLPESALQPRQLQRLGVDGNELTYLPESLAHLGQLRHLDASRNQLSSLPESLGELRQLVTLNLNWNALTWLPESVGRLKHLETFDLGDNQLISLPESLGKLEQLIKLYLGGNSIESLPASLGELGHLRILSLNSNALTSLPDSIGRLKSLETLDLGNNKLTSLPGSLGKLEQLLELHLGGNSIESLPASLGELGRLQVLDLHKNKLHSLPESLGRLVHLRTLNLCWNALKSLPSTLGQLEQLVDLELSGNAMTYMPDPLSRLGRLECLELNRNRLVALPESIGQLQKLRQFDLSHNQLISLPESVGQLKALRQLDVSHNRLKSLPETARNLQSLRELYLHGNDDLRLPIELLEPRADDVRAPSSLKRAKPGEILDYYFRVSHGRRPLNEAKLILVGRPGVGKTSISNRLVNDQFNPEENQTGGIKISEWNVALRADERVRLNIWDFGGQEVLHATHQFFLSRRSLYLLVLTGREGTAEADAEYWLRLIESFGGDSPVIVVLNKVKMFPFDVNRSGLQAKFPLILDWIRTDCQDRSGIDELKEAIIRETDALRELRVHFPESWFAIKDRLAGMEENYLSLDDYRALCEAHGEKNPADQDALASFLHTLGIALNFKDDPRLEYMYVLNPHWVTNAIYKILNWTESKRKKGEFWLRDVSEALGPEIPPASTGRFLLDLMRKFGLCLSFQDDDTHYLIPELLDDQDPVETKEFQPAACLSFQYHYTVLPQGLLPRFIVRTQVLSEGLPRWRTGVILRFQENRALVRADVQDKKVFIHISGPAEGRRDLMAVIRADFERIHGEIPNLKPKEMVPLPDHPDSLVPYQELLVRERAGKKKIEVVVADKLVSLNLHKLLNGVDLEGTRRREPVAQEVDQGLRVFLSYSHEDETLRNELETHLKLLQRQGLISIWHDRKIVPGEDWKNKIDDNLNRADIILVLLSAAFMASDYCYATEMQQALQRHGQGRARLIPIRLRDVDLTGTPIAQLQALNTDLRPIAAFPRSRRDTAWTEVSRGIRGVIEEMRAGPWTFG